MEPILIAGCFIVDNGKLLVLFHKERNYYVLPGGKLEFGETFEAAALREAKEEIGVDFRLGKSLGEHVFSTAGVAYFGKMFLAEIIDGKPTIKKSEKFRDLFWMSMKEYNKYPISPNIRFFCEKLKEQR